MNANVISIAIKVTVIAAVVATAVAPANANSSYKQPGEELSTYSGKLPSMTVVKQWSLVRAKPEAAGVIVDSLALGRQIRVLDIVNKWIMVQYNNGKSSSTGFMHQSLLGYFNSNSVDGETEVNFSEVISSSVHGSDS